MPSRPAIRPLLELRQTANVPVAAIDLGRQIAAAEWLNPAQIRTRQLAQLVALARHFEAQSPRFAQRLRSAGLAPAELARVGGFMRLPPVDRRWLQNTDELFAARIPRGHEPVSVIATSGSTGEPITIRRTHITQLVWLANVLREHRWLKSDFSVPMASIRANFVAPKLLPGWGPPADFVVRTGPFLGLPVAMDAELLFDQLAAFRPGSLVVYPTTLAALLDVVAARGSCLADNPIIRTIGETVSPALRERTMAHFGVRLRDCYSSQEAGHIAIECPDGDCYHVAAEALIVEVLREDGTACEAGETGEVVITDLHNHATPIIRYAIGDHAEVAAPCSCGRGALALKRILGRERNLVLMPDGSRHWPLFGFRQFRELAPIQQFQLVQYAPERIEVRLVAEREVTVSEEAALSAHMAQTLGYPFQFDFRYFTGRLPSSQSGKFEEFLRQF